MDKISFPEKGRIEGYMSSKEAAAKLGYEYTHFTRVLKQGRVPGAQYWNGWLIPENVEVEKLPAGRPLEGYVYLLEGNGWYKIGCAKDPNKRAGWYGVELPFPVKLLHLIESEDCRRLEGELHQRFKHKRVNGEWFSLSPEDVAFIQGL